MHVYFYQTSRRISASHVNVKSHLWLNATTLCSRLCSGWTTYQKKRKPQFRGCWQLPHKYCFHGRVHLWLPRCPNAYLLTALLSLHFFLFVIKVHSFIVSAALSTCFLFFSKNRFWIIKKEHFILTIFFCHLWFSLDPRLYVVSQSVSSNKIFLRFLQISLKTFYLAAVTSKVHK